eukprot:Awhi_evm1s3288
MKILASQIGVTLNFTGPYRHSFLSINKRTHRTINDMFAKFSLEWGSYNQSTHSITGFSLFYLLYGYLPNKPIDLVIIPNNNSNSNNNNDNDD